MTDEKEALHLSPAAAAGASSPKHGRVYDVKRSHTSLFASQESIDGTFLLEEFPETVCKTTTNNRDVSELNSSHVTSDGVAANDAVEENARAAAPPADEPETWLILLTVTPCNVLLGMFWIAFPIFYIEFSEYFETSKGAAGWIGSIQNGLQQFLGLVTSSPIELYGCRVVSLVGSVVVFVGIALSAFATSTVHLYLSYGVVTGACSGGVTGACRGVTGACGNVTGACRG